ncbi:MAG: hypothetical protein AB8B85_07310 [Paracoccaceae bacterium]
MSDIFEDRSSGLESPGYHAVEVTPDDTTDLAFTSRALFIGAPGDLRLTMASGDTVTFANLAAGFVPLRVARVHASGTTASSIVAVW